jgi:hypothetical protein
VAQGRAGEACPTVLFGSGAGAGLSSLLVVQDAFLAVRLHAGAGACRQHKQTAHPRLCVQP